MKTLANIVVPNLSRWRLIPFKCLVVRVLCSIKSVSFPSQSLFNSILTILLFFTRSSESFLGMRAEIATFLSPCYICFADSCILDAISDGDLLDLILFVPMCKITSSGFLSSYDFE